MSFRARRRLVMLRGTAAGAWRRAAQARRRAIVVVGRPVARALGVWHGIVEWFNALALSENTVLIALAVVVGVGGALGVVAFYTQIEVLDLNGRRLAGMVSRSSTAAESGGRETRGRLSLGR